MSQGSEGFEQKRVQEVKGSFYIYLPKDWCTKYQLNQNKRIFLKLQSDDSLVIRPNLLAFEDNQFIIDLDYDPERDAHIEQKNYIDYCFNQYLTAYIIGYPIILLKKRTKIPDKLKNLIQNFTRNLYGMMIIAETDNHITVEEHLSDIDIRLLNRQIITKVGLMISTFIEIFSDFSQESEIYEDLDVLIEQDNQIDGLRYAIERFVHEIMRYPTKGQNISISPIECLHFSETTRMIERIGDYITMLADLLKKQPVVEPNFIKEQLNTMLQYYHTIQDYFDRNDSYTFWGLIKSIRDYSDQIQRMINEDHKDTEYLLYIRRVCNLCSDIAEIRINEILSHSSDGKIKG